MKNKFIVLTVLFLIGSAFTKEESSGKYMCKNGKVSFFSHTPVEDIDAENNKASSILDSKKGSVAIEILIKSFRFKKALMEEHFNENYMESTKYPKAKFLGKIDNLSQINFSKDGTYTANISGKLTIKDKTNDIKTVATLLIKDGKINGKTKFKIKPEDYNVEIPAVVKDKIANELEIMADMDYSPM
ncbi:MAG: YceI family protein [Flavobacteriales bacterium]|nr:YceI family protein [Flavobacteriales bacterium]